MPLRLPRYAAHRCRSEILRANRSALRVIALHPRIGSSTTGGFKTSGIERRVAGDLAPDRLVVRTDTVKRTKSPGTKSIITQAPSRNLDTRTTPRVTPVESAPAALITIDFLACRPPSRTQCTTMPACDSVNAKKAPIANKRDQMIGDPAKCDQESCR